MKLRSNTALIGNSLLAAVWGLIGAPIIMVMLFAAGIGSLGPDAVLYALAIAIVLALAGYAGCVSFLRRWSR